MRQLKVGKFYSFVENTTDVEQERDPATPKVKKEVGVKRERTNSIDDENDDDVVVLETRSRKRQRGTGNEVIVLD